MIEEFTALNSPFDRYLAGDDAARADELNAALRDAPAELRAAHGHWVTSLNLGPLVTSAMARGDCSQLEGERVLDPRTRAGALAEPHDRVGRTRS